jgi:hypothetical protein
MIGEQDAEPQAADLHKPLTFLVMGKPEDFDVFDPNN